MQRFLFPYNGEDPLTPRQGARVLLAWAIVLPLVLSLLVVILPVLMAYSWQRILTLFAFAFFSGLGIFGILGLLVILVNNRSARIRRAWKTRQGQQ